MRSTTALAVAWPGTTSTSGMMCAGLSQWTTRKRSGPRTASAMCFGEIVELVDAMIASGETTSGHAPEDVALEVDELGQRFLHEPAAVKAFEPDPIVDSTERRLELATLDHALLGHQREVPLDLAPRLGEHRGGAAGRTSP